MASRLVVALILTSVLVKLAVSNIGGRTQRVTVRGKLICPSDPAKAKNVQVKLVDEDPGENLNLVQSVYLASICHYFEVLMIKWRRSKPMLKGNSP